MQAVYFGQELHAHAPHAIGTLCIEPATKGPEWVGLAEVVAAMDRGEHVSIRPASASEMKRAADIVALCGLGVQLAERIDDLFEGCDPEDVRKAKEHINKATQSIPFSLLDQI